MGLTTPLPIGALLQSATGESTGRPNLGRDANPIHVWLVTVLPDGIVPPRRERGSDRGTH